MADIFEVIMILCFGVSWPLNITKAWKARTAKGTSLPFYALIWIGYVFGLVSKYIKWLDGTSTPLYVIIVYCLNVVLVSLGIVIYFRNRSLDKTKTAQDV